MKKLLLILSVAVLVVTGAFGQTKPYAGAKLVLSSLDTSILRKNDNLLALLKEKTGIELAMDYIPESAYMTKLQVVLAAGSGEYDIMYANNKMYPVLFPTGWIQPVDDYLKDPKLTNADFNYADFVPGIAANVMYDGKIMGIPFHSESNLLYYNKKLLKDNGFTTPPKTMLEVYEYAKKLNHPEKGYAGIALIGTREGNVNGYGWIMLWLGLGGSWRPAGKTPYAVLANPEALQAAEIWTDMLRNYGPPGISNYGWNELYLAMQQERVAMVISPTNDYPTYTDPTKSKIGDVLGYACMKGPGDMYTVGNIAAWLMAKSGKNNKAAWAAIQFLTSKEAQIKQVVEMNSVNPTRTSVLTSKEFGKYNAEWAAATKEAFAHGNLEYTPLIPQGGQIREYLAIALSKALSGQMTPKDAMEEANANVVKLLANK
jgi:multiple sugar transport system substrate-binding protein/sorbitol/mannitol transport system substrate-binding protein